MAIDRRAFLALGAAAVAAPPRQAWSAPVEPPAFFACARVKPETYLAAGISADGMLRFQSVLPARGHGWAIAAGGACAVVFARRPGRFALAFDPRTGARLGQFEAPAERHFSGHGFFSSDGAFLYAVENNFEAGRGVLGVYERANGFRRRAEIPTHGIGPHEAILLRGGRMAAIANGGILTHPDFPRRKLNLPEMDPSLVFLDLAAGTLIRKWAPPESLRQLSIRHLTEDAEGRVWFGAQYEGPPEADVPLIGSLGLDGSVGWAKLDPSETRGLRHYVGSMAALGGGRQIAATSPVGGQLFVLNARTGQIVSQHRRSDICGVAPAQRGFLASDGSGALIRDGHTVARHPGWAWDNHLARSA